MENKRQRNMHHCETSILQYQTRIQINNLSKKIWEMQSWSIFVVSSPKKWCSYFSKDTLSWDDSVWNKIWWLRRIQKARNLLPSNRHSLLNWTLFQLALVKIYNWICRVVEQLEAQRGLQTSNSYAHPTSNFKPAKINISV